MNDTNRKLNLRKIRNLKVLILCNLFCTIIEISYFIYNLYYGIYTFKPDLIGIIIGAHLGINITSLYGVYNLTK